VALSFGLAPAVFLAAHLYTLIRYDMLETNVRRFMGDLPAIVPVEADRERCGRRRPTRSGRSYWLTKSRQRQQQRPTKSPPVSINRGAKTEEGR